MMPAIAVLQQAAAARGFGAELPGHRDRLVPRTIVDDRHLKMRVLRSPNRLHGTPEEGGSVEGRDDDCDRRQGRHSLGAPPQEDLAVERDMLGGDGCLVEVARHIGTSALRQARPLGGIRGQTLQGRD